MHKLTSNQSVIFNAETQQSGILEITPEQIVYQNDGNNHHGVTLAFPVKESGTNNYIAGLFYTLTATDWNTFFASQTLTSTDEYDKQQEAALYYAKDQLNGNWGLTSADWTYSDH